MIYRVGDQEHPGYDYSRQKPTQITGDSEKFSLDHRKDEDFSSKKKEKGEDKKLHEKKDAASLKEKSGVKLELSDSGTRLSAKEEKKKASASAEAFSGSEVWHFVRETFGKLIQYAKELFYKIWNDPSPEAASMDVTPEEAERYTQEYYAIKGELPPEEMNRQDAASAALGDNPFSEKDKLTDSVKLSKPVNRDVEIQKYLHSGNLEQVLSLLTDNGKKSVAKNSTLLTYYDKSGRLTSVNPSDSERILHGDRHTRTL